MEMGGQVTPDCVVLEAKVPTTQQVRDRMGLTACTDTVIKKTDVPCLDEKRTLALQLAGSHYTETTGRLTQKIMPKSSHHKSLL